MSNNRSVPLNLRPSQARITALCRGIPVEGLVLDTSLTFAVQRWCLWTPLAGGGARSVSACPERRDSRDLDTPELPDIAPMQRRRLSPLARVVFHCLQHCGDDAGTLPLVYSSVMGEIQRTHALLENLAQARPLSPAAFSLSVHNAIAGLWSLQRGNRGTMQALAPAAASPVPALLEARGLLEESRVAAVLVVFAEEHYPAFYDPWLQGPAGPWALALRLVADGDSASAACRFSLRPGAGACAADTTANAGALARLVAGEARTVVREDGREWHLERAA